MQVKSLYVGQDHAGDVPLSKKIAAGFTTGAIAISVANPTDLVKVRLQAEGKLAPGMPHRYAGAMDAYAKIATQVCVNLQRVRFGALRSLPWGRDPPLLLFQKRFVDRWCHLTCFILRVAWSASMHFSN